MFTDEQKDAIHQMIQAELLNFTDRVLEYLEHRHGNIPVQNNETSVKVHDLAAAMRSALL